MTMDEPFNNGDEEMSPREEAEFRTRESNWLTDYEYVAGQGSPFCKDNLVLMYAPWRESSNLYDRTLSYFGAQRRYLPTLVYYLVQREPRTGKVPGYEADGKTPKLAKDSRDGTYRTGRSGQFITEGRPIYMDWTSSFLAIGSSEVSAEQSRTYKKFADHWNLNRKLPNWKLTAPEKQIARELGKLYRKLRKGNQKLCDEHGNVVRPADEKWWPGSWKQNDDDELDQKWWRNSVDPDHQIVVERRWILDRNHPETYQQYYRNILGRVPTWEYYKIYNQLRKLQQAQPNKLVEDPYGGARRDLLVRTDPKGRVRIGKLNDFELATLAEYIAARRTLNYAQSWEWFQDMRARAIHRAALLVKQGKLRRADVADFVDDWFENNTYWITPSCANEFTKKLARNLRTDRVTNLPPLNWNETQNVKNRKDKSKRHAVRDLINSDILKPTDVADIADSWCRDVNAFCHIIRGIRVTFEGGLDHRNTLVFYPVVEEDRDRQRDNENEIEVRTGVQAREGGLMDNSRVNRARDRGVGGRRSRQLWWYDPKFRLLWCLTHRFLGFNENGTENWAPRYNEAEMGIADEAERLRAWNKRGRNLMLYAWGVKNPKTRDYRPPDTATFSRLNGRYASVTRGSDLNVVASTKALNSGYTRKDLNDDLPGSRNYLRGSYEGNFSPEDFMLRLELANYVDFREVYKNHKGAWTWYQAEEQNVRVRRVDPRLEVNEETWLGQSHTLRGQFQLQPTGPFLEHMQYTMAQAEEDHLMDTLTPIQKVYHEMPGAEMFVPVWDPNERTYYLQPFTINGEEVGGREAFQQIVRDFRHQALDNYENFVADETFPGWARTYKNFDSANARGVYWNIGNEEISQATWEADQSEWWYSKVHDRLTTRANIQEADGLVWAPEDDIKDRREMLSSGIGLHFGNGQERRIGGPVWSVQRNHMMVWLIKRCGFPMLTEEEIVNGTGVTFETAEILMRHEIEWDSLHEYLVNLGLGDWEINRIFSMYVSSAGHSSAAAALEEEIA